MDLNFLEQLADEELRFKKFSLVGTSNVQAAGSLKAGYAVNINVGAAPETSPAPPTCSETATITLSDVVLDCGCTQIGAGFSLRYAIGTDIGGINGNPQVLDLDGFTCATADCHWFNHTADGVYFNEADYLLSDCSDIPIPIGTRFCDMYITLKAGVYQVLITAINSIIFYGTTTDISTPISNVATSCIPAFTAYGYDDPVMGKLLQCEGFDNPSFFSTIAHGGTAMITIP